MAQIVEQCPECGSYDTDYDEINASDGNVVVFDWYCYKCPCWWNAEYTLLKRYVVQHEDAEEGDIE